MKPNDKAIDAALNTFHIVSRKVMTDVLTAAYAAQFQSEDYAAERERCVTAVEKVAERINVPHHERPEWEDGYLQGVHDAAAAIRSGK